MSKGSVAVCPRDNIQAKRKRYQRIASFRRCWGRNLPFVRVHSYPLTIFFEFEGHLVSQMNNPRWWNLHQMKNTCFMPSVVHGPVYVLFTLIGTITHPVRSQDITSFGSCATKTADAFFWKNLPSLAVGCQRNAQISTIVGWVTEAIVLAIVPIDSFSLVNGVIEQSACGGIVDSIFKEGLYEAHLVAVVEDGRVLPISHRQNC